MAKINKISLKNLDKAENIVCGLVLFIFIFLFIFFIYFNNLSLYSITNFLFDYDLGRIVLIVLLLGVTSYNLFLGILFLGVVVFLYEYDKKNISKYNNTSSTSSTIDPEFNVSSNKKNPTVQDILNLENNISSKQSNNRIGLGFVHQSNNDNNNNNMNINPSYEEIFNSNFASVY